MSRSTISGSLGKATEELKGKVPYSIKDAAIQEANSLGITVSELVMDVFTVRYVE